MYKLNGPKHFVVLLVGLVAATVVVGGYWLTASAEAGSGSGDGSDHTSSATKSAGETADDYGQAYKQFEAAFPDGVALPNIDDQLKRFENMARADGANGSHFEDGFAESQLVTNWQCAWERKYVDANSAGNEPIRDHAAEQLKRFYDLDAAKRWYSDPDHSWYKHVVEPAVSYDDVRPMIEDLNNSCGAPFALD